MSTPSSSKRILFSVRNFWFLKFYGSVLRALARRGHRIHIVADRPDVDVQYPEWMAAVESLVADCPTVTYGWLPRRGKDRYHELRLWILRLSDYVRFLEPQYVDTPVLRRRAEHHTSPTLRRLLEPRWPGHNYMVRALQVALHVLDRAISPTPHLQALIREQQPDLLMVSPLVTLGSRQGDVVRASRHVGVPSVFAAGSWDHLSSKARIRDVPDSVMVWNPTQRREAVDYHGIPASRVIVTGAQCFDEWFDRTPSRDRSAFCRDVGLADDRPLIVYVCSSLFWGSPLEAIFVERWVEAVRTSPHAVLRDAAILIRPHPKRGAEWKKISLERFDNVRVWPPFGEPPLGPRAKADYFDSLFHADAIVGLNTSAQIEGALIGRPVFTVLLPEFWDNQEGTLHFHYLLERSGGPLHAGRSLDEHLEQLVRGLADPAQAAARNQTFVETFVRPHGLTRSSTETFVQAVEQLAQQPHRPLRARLAVVRGATMRAMLMPVAAALLLTPAGNGRDRQRVKERVRALRTPDDGTTLKHPGKRLEPARKQEEHAAPPDALSARPARKPRKKEAPAAVAASDLPVVDPLATPKTIGPDADRRTDDRRKEDRRAPAELPAWAWQFRGMLYPIASRINLGSLSDERRWRAARYRQKELEREAERARGLEQRAAKLQERALQKKLGRTGGKGPRGAANADAVTSSPDPAFSDGRGGSQL